MHPLSLDHQEGMAEIHVRKQICDVALGRIFVHTTIGFYNPQRRHSRHHRRVDIALTDHFPI
jgi:hypothetical protein